ncbi:hypothetical protein [Cryobacterium sp. Hb1]|uniref:hypothetical protein n=1 Tax=Cryobacterium sp. Hb1 TaxID=1259147 RepID=UPI00141B4522|nr:hypothetical protein [Cryobacterium sp. Hb1]
MCGIPDIQLVDHGSDFTNHHLERTAILRSADVPLGPSRAPKTQPPEQVFVRQRL